MNISDAKIIVVDPGTQTAETACYEHVRTLTECDVSYVLPALESNRDYPNIDSRTAGVIVLGSGASVHDQFQWQEKLHSWLHGICVNNIPILGICYGHQAIAHVFGGTVDLLWNGHKAKGTRPMFLNCNDLKLSNHRGEVIVSHREGVTKMPENFRLIAESQACPIDGIKHNNLPIWGFQAHIEAVPQFLKNNQIKTPGKTDQFDFGHMILKAFLEYVKETYLLGQRSVAN